MTAEEPEEKDEKVVDLMAALRDSLKGGGASRAKAERFMAAHKDKAKTKARKKPSRKRAA